MSNLAIAAIIASIITVSSLAYTFIDWPLFSSGHSGSHHQYHDSNSGNSGGGGGMCTP